MKKTSTNFMHGILEHYTLNHGENRSDIKRLHALIKYAERKNIHGTNLAYFISDNFDKLSFGEVAIYIDDCELSKPAKLEKYKSLIEIKRTYKGWMLYFYGENIAHLSDKEIQKYLRSVNRVDRLVSVAEMCTNAVRQLVNENAQEEPNNPNINKLLENGPFWTALKKVWLNAFANYYKIK